MVVLTHHRHWHKTNRRVEFLKSNLIENENEIELNEIEKRGMQKWTSYFRYYRSCFICTYIKKLFLWNTIKGETGSGIQHGTARQGEANRVWLPCSDPKSNQLFPRRRRTRVNARSARFYYRFRPFTSGMCYNKDWSFATQFLFTNFFVNLSNNYKEMLTNFAGIKCFIYFSQRNRYLKIN